jgi:hypothetical protein
MNTTVEAQAYLEPRPPLPRRYHVRSLSYSFFHPPPRQFDDVMRVNPACPAGAGVDQWTVHPYSSRLY